MRPDRFATARAPRDLRRGARVVSDARTAREGRAVRLGPGEYLGPGPSRAGRFGKVDPFDTSRIWGLWEWVGFVFWAGVTAEAGRRAWKQHGGPGGDRLDGDGVDPGLGGGRSSRLPSGPHPAG